MNEIFTGSDKLDMLCDIVFVVEDGKQFKAHRKVLSEASPYFEKLLNSDMKESIEGIVRLEMFSESVMAATLEFIYTGHVQILTEDNARDLIVVADYLLLQKLKALAEGVLAQKLNILNCISTYYVSERYQCEELLSNTRKFILANFTAVYVANREDILNMSSKEIEMWISSDEIDVKTEEDVFKIILAWIDHDKGKRKKYFPKLFRRVLLFFMSRDFLINDVVTNDLVKENEDCLHLVKDAISLIDSKNCESLSIPPRKSLETTVIVMYRGSDILCYFFDENNWYQLGEVPVEYSSHGIFAPYDGKIYSTVHDRFFRPLSLKIVIYNPYSNSWMRAPSLEVEDKYIEQIYAKNGQVYAVMLDALRLDCERILLTAFLKYKVESNSWEETPTFENLGLRHDICIVAQDNFIYFIGGVGWYFPDDFRSDVDRYNLNTNQWDQVADIQVARKRALGAAANGKIFIAGGVCQEKSLPKNCECEMYSETTNEWQFITSFSMKPEVLVNLLAIDGKLYALGRTHENRNIHECDLLHVRIECYEAEKNEWKIITETAIPSCSTTVGACSMRIFKRLFNIRPVLETFPSSSLAGATTTQDMFFPKARKRKCCIM